MPFIDVEKIATELLARSGQPRLPNGTAIDVEQIARVTCDYDVVFVSSLVLAGKRLSGVIVPDRKMILIEADEGSVRKRFTVAHELGHFEIDYGARSGRGLFDETEKLPPLWRCGESDVSESVIPDRKEMLANKFAAALLMPRGLVRELWDKHGTVPDCADALGVSKKALEIRLRDLRFV